MVVSSATKRSFRWTAAGVLASAVLGFALLGLGLADFRIAPLLALLTLLLVLPEIVQNEKRRQKIQWASVVVCLIFTVVIGILWPRPKPADLRLYYGDSELNGKMITAAKDQPPTSCAHVQLDPNLRHAFELCGIWARNDGDEATTPNAVYLNFSVAVNKQTVSDCWARSPSSEDGYPVEFRCSGWTTPVSPKQRWDLPWFYGTPTPPDGTKVKIRVFYGQKRPAESTFTWRRPNPKG